MATDFTSSRPGGPNRFALLARLGLQTRSDGVPQAGGATDVTLPIITICAITAFFFSGFYLYYGDWPADLAALYVAAYAFDHGQPDLVYNVVNYPFILDMQENWVPLLEQIGAPDELALPYLYPPLWVNLMAPVTRIVGPQAFFDAVYVLQMGMLSGSVFLGMKITNLPRDLRLAWTAAAFAIMAIAVPTLEALYHNQLQITVAFTTLVAFAYYRARAFAVAGAILGVAAAMKLTPAIFGLILLLDRNWRAIGAMAISGFGLLALSIALSGVDLHSQMLTRLGEIDAMTIWTPSNYSPEFLFYQLHNFLTGSEVFVAKSNIHPELAPPLWVQYAPKVLMVLGLGYFVKRSWGADGALALGPRVLVLSLLVGLLGPLSWSHYFIFSLALLPALFTMGCSERTAWKWVLLVGYVVCLPMFPIYAQMNILLDDRVLFSAIMPCLVLSALALFGLARLPGATDPAQRVRAD